jgi:hypothetical protein
LARNSAAAASMMRSRFAAACSRLTLMVQLCLCAAQPCADLADA